MYNQKWSHDPMMILFTYLQTDDVPFSGLAFFCVAIFSIFHCVQPSLAAVNKSRQKQPIKGCSVQRKPCYLTKITSARDNDKTEPSTYLKQVSSVPLPNNSFISQLHEKSRQALPISF